LTRHSRSPVPNHRAPRRISKASGKQGRSGTRAPGYRAAFSVLFLKGRTAPLGWRPRHLRAVLIARRKPAHSNFRRDEKDLRAAGLKPPGGPSAVTGQRLRGSADQLGGTAPDISQVSGPLAVLNSLRVVWPVALTCWPFSQAVARAGRGHRAARSSRIVARKARGPPVAIVLTHAGANRP
jgi:hypothetical protein